MDERQEAVLNRLDATGKKVARLHYEATFSSTKPSGLADTMEEVGKDIAETQAMLREMFEEQEAFSPRFVGTEEV